MMKTMEERQTLCAAIEQQRAEMVRETVADLYRNPFWEARFAERGRQRADEDASHHLSHLITAIEVDSAATLKDYFSWLQSVLVTRGMCTRHLVDTADCMAQHLSRALGERWPEVESYYAAFYDGLTYQHPDCLALERVEMAVAEAVTRQMYAQELRSQYGLVESGRARCRLDNLYHLSYLKDATAFASADIFLHYWQWITSYLAGHGVSGGAMAHTARLLRAELLAQLPAQSAAPFAELLQQASA